MRVIITGGAGLIGRALAADLASDGHDPIVLLDGQRAVSRRLLDLGFIFRFPDAEAALRDLLKKGD